MLLGELAADFLRVGGVATPQQQQIQADHDAAAALQAQQAGGYMPVMFQGMPRLSVTINSVSPSFSWSFSGTCFGTPALFSQMNVVSHCKWSLAFVGQRLTNVLWLNWQHPPPPTYN